MRTRTKLADLVHVPSELMIEILTWLPVKTLMRFKCVCKLWKSLTDNKDFVKLHLKRSPKNKHVLFILREATSTYGFADFNATIREALSAYCSADTIVIRRPVRPLFEDPSSMIDDGGCLRSEAMSNVIGICNGLVCFLSHRVYTPIFQLWNPATGLWSENSPTVGIHACIVGYGFGYDDSSDTYKVVAFSNIYNNLETTIYRMGDSCWRKISSNPGFQFAIMQRNGQFVGGCVNWLVDDLSNYPNHNHDRLKQLVIVSFDMSKEAYKSLSLPEGISVMSQDETPIDLGILGNCLCLFQNHKRTDFVVWQMREYGVRESWTRLLSVSYDHLQCDGYVRHIPFMCLCEDGDILMLLKYRGFDAIMYNVRDNSVKHVQLPNNKRRWLNIYGYVESLVSPY